MTGIEALSQPCAPRAFPGTPTPADGRCVTGRETTTANRCMKQSIVHVALVVRDYDEAIEFFTRKLDFTVVEDTYQAAQDKRWVVVAPPGSAGSTLLLARAANAEQAAFIGNQSGGRVFLFLGTDDFRRDYEAMTKRGVVFVREPKSQDYGTVAVFEDLYGNLWDLVEFAPGHPCRL